MLVNNCSLYNNGNGQRLFYKHNDYWPLLTNVKQYSHILTIINLGQLPWGKQRCGKPMGKSVSEHYLHSWWVFDIYVNVYRMVNRTFRMAILCIYIYIYNYIICTQAHTHTRLHFFASNTLFLVDIHIHIYIYTYIHIYIYTYIHIYIYTYIHIYI